MTQGGWLFFEYCFFRVLSVSISNRVRNRFLTFLLALYILGPIPLYATCDDQGKYLFVSSETLKYSMGVNERLIKAKFNRCNVVVGGRRDVLRKGFDIGLHVRNRLIYQNLGDFENDLNSGRLKGVVDIVIYNPEPGFINTPEEEKADPVHYAIRFANLAKENGLLSVAAPSCRLVKERDALLRFQICAKQIIKKIAPYYDFIDIQAQSVQNNTALYQQIVNHVADAIRSSNRKTKIIAQISTVDRLGGNADTMANAAIAVKNIVDGFWINVDNKSTDGKNDFIELIMKDMIY